MNYKFHFINRSNFFLLKMFLHLFIYGNSIGLLHLCKATLSVQEDKPCLDHLNYNNNKSKITSTWQLV